jgi:hypothetical protein
MEQGPSCEATGLQPVKIFPACMEIYSLLSHSQVPPWVPILSQIDPVQAHLSDFSHLRLGLLRDFLFTFTQQNPVYTSLLLCSTICRAHLVHYDLFARVMFGAVSSILSLYRAYDIIET